MGIFPSYSVTCIVRESSDVFIHSFNVRGRNLKIHYGGAFGPALKERRSVAERWGNRIGAEGDGICPDIHISCIIMHWTYWSRGNKIPRTYIFVRSECTFSVGKGGDFPAILTFYSASLPDGISEDSIFSSFRQKCKTFTHLAAPKERAVVVLPV